jgi:hypothetical protein
MTQMKRIGLVAISAALVLGGCAGLIRQTPAPGDTQAAVVAKLGRPTAVYPDPPGKELEYATAPNGQYTWMAHIGPDGRLVRYEQVLTGEKFAAIHVDCATKQDVLRTIGQPAERSYLPLRHYKVWSYRYKENGVWNSMMHVHFDRAGVVRLMQNGPDPLYQYEQISFN